MEELPHILVVDDDRRLRSLLSRYLTDNGFRVTTAGDTTEARHKMTAFEFDLLVLDLMMPGENGLDFAAGLRRHTAIPILMLTAMGETDDRIAGLEHGADDYMSKPFEPRELVLRIQTVLRRMPHQSEPEGDVTFGPCRFDIDRGELFRDEKRVKLTESEAKLLSALARQPGAPMTREDLSRETGVGGGGRSIDVQVTRLRRKTEHDPKDPRYLQTVRGKGYVLLPD